jgi:hypothetical protein
MGSVFVWQEETTNTEVPTTLLQEVLIGRVTRHTPLIAAWTSEPSDNATIEIRTDFDPASKRLNIQPRSTYRSRPVGQIAPDKAYWLHLRFLDNQSLNPIDVLDAIELERN